MRRRFTLPSPNGVDRVLSTGEAKQINGSNSIASRLSLFAFFVASLMFMANSLGGGSSRIESEASSLRKPSSEAAQFLVPGYTVDSMASYKKERRELAVTKSGLNPAEENIFDAHELKEYFDCYEVNEKRSVITQEEWWYFRDLYNDFIAIEASRGRNDTYKLGSSDITSPVTGVMTPDKGRGLVASRDIKKGEMIFTSTNNTIVYRTGDAWRGFLLHLYYSPPLNDHYKDGFACDIRAWSWNQEIETAEGVVLAIVVDLDSSSILNRPSRGQVHNIQCGKLGEDDSECGMDYYAVKDIKKGEEILCTYSDFSDPQWKTFGL